MIKSEANKLKKQNKRRTELSLYPETAGPSFGLDGVKKELKSLIFLKENE